MYGHYCLSNGLCLEPNYWTLYRHSCTDAKYEASGCPRFCFNTSSSGQEASNDLSGVNFCGPRQWKCNTRVPCNTSNFSISDMGTIMPNNAQKAQLGLQSGISESNISENGVSESGISAGAVVGIGAGIGIPLAIVAGVLGILLLRQRKKTKAVNLISANSTSEANSPKTNQSATTSPAPWGEQQTAELPLEFTVRHELPQ
ncbi:hypothetical protein CGCSCA4_v006541 [Colletotrichum siamense]|uniref:Uncharacterized protein n=1 Tax=Colletotrichum siamense TaxID=690259 RepID=A0A9P5BWA5_COLSI|nr:hypothetical protein CGCSCA4_v006541 [Colletotrichum siamense]KAF4847722.1 hypothetical protein CGCSCA2_v012608 [Colletotrichum siamense]